MRNNDELFYVELFLGWGQVKESDRREIGAKLKPFFNQEVKLVNTKR